MNGHALHPNNCRKSIKSIIPEHLSGKSYGHSILKMMRDLPKIVRPGRELLKKVAELDKFYIPIRYTNGFDWGAPMDYFEIEDAEEEIISYAKSKIFK